jgi:ribosomal protein S18 acetylase RimI-like enzyme
VNVAPFPQRVRIADWRSVGADRMQPLIDAEAERWVRLLDWDAGAQWKAIDAARQAGTAPGLVALDPGGAVAGWSHYRSRNGILQIASFTASSEAVSQAMLNELLNERTLAFAQGVTFFAFSEAQGLAAALRTKGLTVDRYWYLGKDLHRGAPPAQPPLRLWQATDLSATAALFARVYEPRAEARPFAPGGSAAEWTDYVFRLTQGHGCGPLEAEASLCMPSGPGRLSGVALVTRISEGTAHLAQLAVDPEMRRRKVAVQMMDAAFNAAARLGCRRVTLLVGGSNQRARSLYDVAGFRPMGSFLSAGTLSPRKAAPTLPSHAFLAGR